jgi:hypothetical protein
MRELANGMAAHKGDKDQFYRNDRYNESARALDANGMVRSEKTERGQGLLRQITEAGLHALQSSSGKYRAPEMSSSFKSEGGLTAYVPGISKIVTPKSDNTMTKAVSSEQTPGRRTKKGRGRQIESPGELISVVMAYNLNAGPGMLVRSGSAPAYRQICPQEWQTSQIHYEFHQACGRIGAELHLASGLAPGKIVAIAEFLKSFVGRAVANGDGELIWHQKCHGGRGGLAALFPLTTSPETVAAAMWDLFSITRSGLSESLLSKTGTNLATRVAKEGLACPKLEA